jgi:hypothetical protein
VRGSNDWGVPDWLNVAQYPMHAGSSAGAAWAWEFLRRNRQYREFWTKDVLPFVLAEGSIDVDASVGKCRSIKTDGAEIPWGVVKEVRDRFGLLAGPRNPRSSSVVGLFMDRNAIREIYAHPEAQVRLARREVAYVFDLGRPLEPQFARALQDARGVRAHRVRTGEVEVEPARRRTDRYVLYLRVIDAEDAGDAPKRIKDVLFGTLRRSTPTTEGRPPSRPLAAPRIACATRATARWPRPRVK